MSRGPIPDKPRDRPTVAEVQRLVDAYYQFDGCGVGGGLHCVLDDGNLSDIDIQLSIDDAADHWSGHVIETKLLGRLLLLLTRTQRRKIHAGYDGKPMDSEAFIVTAAAILDRLAPAVSPGTK